MFRMRTLRFIVFVNPIIDTFKKEFGGSESYVQTVEDKTKCSFSVINGITRDTLYVFVFVCLLEHHLYSLRPILME